MTDDERGPERPSPAPDELHHDHHPVEETPDSRPVLVAVQVFALAAFTGYAVLGMLREVPLDRLVLFGLLAFGLGVRPETLGTVLRAFTGRP